MFTHQTSNAPIALINFETLVYKDGKGFSISTELTRKNTPPPQKKVKLLLNSLSRNFRIFVYADEHFTEALQWIVKNKLYENCVWRLTRKKSKTTLYIERL